MLFANQIMASLNGFLDSVRIYQIDLSTLVNVRWLLVESCRLLQHNFSSIQRTIYGRVKRYIVSGIPVDYVGCGLGPRSKFQNLS